MAVFAVRTLKRASYFGDSRIFGNTYHYQPPAAVPFDDEAAALACIAAERTVTSSEVEFIGWSSWGPTDGSDFDNVMRDSGQLSQQGLVGLTIPMYREICSLVVWPLPRSPITNRRRWLRKFLRSAPGAISSPYAELEGNVPLSSAVQEQFDTQYIPDVTVQGAGNDIFLCTEDGTEPTGPGEVRPYLYTRQIGR